MWILFLLVLGDALELVLLLGGVAAGAALGGVDSLVGQALSARLWERVVSRYPLFTVELFIILLSLTG